MEHKSPQFIEEAVYGLCEVNREDIKKARLIANPGCYTTCSILTCYPLVKEGLIDVDTLIIDAKYYGHTTQSQYGVHSLHSGNLYQVFTYVKNKDAEFGDEPHVVSGMLLYAQTDETVQPNHVYHMSGNQITVRTLNLNLPFKKIAAQLDEIVESHFSNA